MRGGGVLARSVVALAVVSTALLQCRGGLLAPTGDGGAGDASSSGSGGSSSGAQGSSGASSSSGGGSFPGPPCAPDDAVTCNPDSTGFQCEPESSPQQLDSSLTCSSSLPDPNGDLDYCCLLPQGSSGSSSGGAPGGCTVSTTTICSGDAIGYVCPVSDNPQAEDPSIACSVPTSAGSEVAFCCFPWTPTDACVPDDGLTSTCPDPDSYGFQCIPGNDPTTIQSRLNCSVGVVDPDGAHDDFCCDYQ